MTKTEYGYTIELAIEERGLYFYTFYIEHRGFFVYDSRHNGRFSAYEDREYQFTVSSADFETPAWLKGGVMYQIFPDRFCRADIDIKVSAENEPVLEGRILREDWGGMPSYRPNENGKVLNRLFRRKSARHRKTIAVSEIAWSYCNLPESYFRSDFKSSL